MGEVRELDAQVSHLRKNPTDKLTNDLLVYQYNKKKEILKQDISSIDKEIYRLNFDLENFDTSILSPSETEEFAEEIAELHEPEPELEPEPEINTEEPTAVEDSPKANNFKLLFKGLYDIRSLLISGLVTLSILWALFVCDRLNLIGYFNRYTRFKFFSFLLAGIFALTICSVYAYKDISKKPFGAFSDYFMLVCLASSLGIALLYAIQNTHFKLFVFLCLAIYSLIYFVLRIKLYNKDIKQALAKKPKIMSYYYELFGKYSLIIISLIATLALIVLYLAMSLKMVTSWLKSDQGHRPYMIITLIIVALFVLYFSALSVVRINEQETKIIDVFALIVQIVSVEFFVLTRLLSATISTIFYLLFALLLLLSIALTIYRIIKYKNE